MLIFIGSLVVRDSNHTLERLDFFDFNCDEVIQFRMHPSIAELRKLDKNTSFELMILLFLILRRWWM